MKKTLATLLAGAAVTALLMSGCADPNITRTGRSAIEQLVLTTAADRTIGKMSFRFLKGEKVRIDYSNMTPQVDKNYIQGILEARVSATGAIIALKPDEAKYVLRPVCATFATEDDKIMFGTPQLPIPIPEAGISVIIPELPIFKRIRRFGYCKLGVEVLEAKTNKQVRIEGPFISGALNTNWVILFFPFVTRDFKVGETGPIEYYWLE